jgi:hypothetical protein
MDLYWESLKVQDKYRENVAHLTEKCPKQLYDYYAKEAECKNESDGCLICLVLGRYTLSIQTAKLKCTMMGIRFL